MTLAQPEDCARQQGHMASLGSAVGEGGAEWQRDPLFSEHFLCVSSPSNPAFHLPFSVPRLLGFNLNRFFPCLPPSRLFCCNCHGALFSMPLATLRSMPPSPVLFLYAHSAFSLSHTHSPFCLPPPPPTVTLPVSFFHSQILMM